MSRGPGNSTIGPRAKVLRDGERKALESLKSAIDLYGDEDPIVAEATMILLCISRGDTGYTGRHIGARLRAVNLLLDRRLGKPGEGSPRGGRAQQPAKMIFQEIEGVGLPETDPDE